LSELIANEVRRKEIKSMFVLASVAIVLANLSVLLSGGTVLVKVDITLLSPDNDGLKDLWWNENWAKRRPVTINNSNNPNTLENYQVRVIIYTDDDMRADFGDLRFCDNDGVTELNYWIENYNAGENATVWVKVPSIPGNDNHVIYMYYGNPVAEPAGDGSGVFEFFDNFDNATKFSTENYPYGDPYVASQNNFVEFGNNGNEEYVKLGCYDEGELRKNLNLPSSSYKIVVKWRTANDPWEYDNADYTNYDDEYGASTWTPKRLIIINGNKIHEKDRKLLSYSEMTEVTYTGAIDNLYLSVGSSGSYENYFTYYDLAFIRKLTYPEPVANVGGEESNNAPSAPNLLEPENNAYENDTTPLFRWGNSIDPEGDSLRYTLQIDNEASFTTPIYERIGITENQHELPAENALSDGVYYWRVGARDMVNPDNWAEAFTLTIDTVAPQSPNLQAPLDGAATNDNTPTLIWTVITTENSWPVTYGLQVDNDPDFSSPEINRDGLADNAYTPTADLVDDVYFWRVRATDGAGNMGEWSIVWNFMIDTVPPVAPTLVRPENGKNIKDGTPDVSWNAVTESSLPVTYYVAVSDNHEFPYENRSSGWIMDNGWEVSPALPESVWYWRVKARDNAGNAGAWSEDFWFRIDATAPPTPILVWPENGGNLNDNTPNLDWDAVIENSMPVTYDVQVDNDDNFDSPLIWENDIADDSYQVLNAMVEGIWYWRVRAEDNAGNIGAWAEGKWFRIDVTPPAAPTLFSPANGLRTNDNTPTFEWTPVSDVSAPVTYEIWIDNDFDFTSREAENSGQIGNSYVPTALADENYNWKVRARDNAGNFGEWSNVWTFLIDTVVPDIPLKLAPNDGAVTNDNTPTFTWSTTTDDSSGIRCYEIWIDNDLDFTSPERLENTADNTTTSYTPTALVDENYSWLVRAWDWAGNVGNFETPWTILIDTTPPGAPTLVWPLDGENINDNTPNLDWTTVPENSLPLLYRCHVSDNSAFPYDNYDSGWISSDNFQITAELKEGIWYWCVQARDNAGNTGENSAARSFRLDLTPPDKPSLISPGDNVTENTPSMTFTWTQPELNVTYHIQIDDEASFTSPYVHENFSVADNSYPYTFARVGVYYWRVRARDNAGNLGGWSDNFKLTIRVAVMPGTPHDPIYIENDDFFNLGNGVLAGRGTEDDPYIIENWIISAENANGIEIRNTTAYFVVRNCLVENGRVDFSHGVYLRNVVHAKVENCVCRNNIYGIYLRDSYDNNSISHNICSNNYHGIYLCLSSNNILSNNICENNSYYGIALYPFTSNNTLDNNICVNNRYGIYIYHYSDNNIITNNTCSNNTCGIRIYDYSDNNTLDNNACENNFRGLYIENSRDIKMRNDILSNNRYNLGVTGTVISHFVHDIDPSNLVNGKSIWYLVDGRDEVIAPPLDVGYLVLVNCDNIRVENLMLRNNEQGILLVSTENCWIGNCALENNFWGAYLYSSNNNFVSHNNFVNNDSQAYDDGSNHWDDGYPSGGNYWSDYTGNDNYHGENQDLPGSDGIGDVSYVIPGDNNQDRYPLMEPWPHVRIFITLSISPSYQRGFPGENLLYVVTLTNFGNINDNYQLKVSDNSGWNTELSENQFTDVPPGMTRTTTLTVEIPADAENSARDNIIVIATSQADNTVSDNDSCIAQALSLIRAVDVSISPPENSGLPGENVTFTVTVKNTGTIEDNYTLDNSDDQGWPLKLDNTIITVPANESRTTSLTVTLPENAMLYTYDHIMISATSKENAEVRDNASCIARVTHWTGTASIRLATGSPPSPPFLWGIRKVRVNANLVVNQGDNLRLRFLGYDNKTVEWEDVIWSRTAPGPENVILTNLIVPHDNTLPYPSGNVKRVKLVLTDSAGNVILDNMAWEKVVQDDWGTRVSWIILNWGSHTSAQRDQLGSEVTQVILNWAGTPTGRDRRDFSQA
jgi:parallel beta-helix repeat protein